MTKRELKRRCILETAYSFKNDGIEYAIDTPLFEEAYTDLYDGIRYGYRPDSWSDDTFYESVENVLLEDYVPGDSIDQVRRGMTAGRSASSGGNMEGGTRGGAPSGASSPTTSVKPTQPSPPPPPPPPETGSVGVTHNKPTLTLGNKLNMEYPQNSNNVTGADIFKTMKDNNRTRTGNAVQQAIQQEPAKPESYEHLFKKPSLFDRAKALGTRGYNYAAANPGAAGIGAGVGAASAASVWAAQRLRLRQLPHP